MEGTLAEMAHSTGPHMEADAPKATARSYRVCPYLRSIAVTNQD